jgi:hypothetical protein
MADSFTDCGQILQTNGENSGTWGTETNTNWLINLLLLGANNLSQSITSGDVTLPDVNGVADSGKNTLITTSGTLTGNRNLIVPTKARKYTIINNCSGAFTMTVKTSAGTGIAVPQGTTMNLICDGTNIIEGVTAIQSLKTTTRASVVQTVSTSGTTQTVNATTANVWNITLTANCAITLAGAAASGYETIVRVRLIQNATGGWTTTFAGGTFKWLGQTTQSTAPTFTTTANYVSEVEFRTVDGGTNWTGQLVGSGSSSGGGVSPTSGTYVIVGGSGKVSSSSDGVTWNLQATQLGGNNLSCISYSNSGFPFASDVSSTTTMRFTANGTVFSGNTTTNATSIKSIATNANYAVFAGTLESTGGSQAIVSVMNGTSFSTSSIGNGATFSAKNVLITSDASSNFIAVITNGTGFDYTTGNTAFTATGLTHSGGGSGTITSLNYAGGYYLLGYSTGEISYKSSISSTTLTNVATVIGANQINKILYTGTKWAAVGNAGKVANSSAIGTWTSRTTGLAGNIVDAAYNGGILMVVTDAGEIARSLDNGDTWSILSGSNNPFGGSALKFIKFRLTNFWTGGAGGKLAASSDGTSFSLVSTGMGSDTVNGFEAA